LKERSRARFRLVRTRVARAGLHLARAERHEFTPDRSMAALNVTNFFDIGKLPNWCRKVFGRLTTLLS